MKPRIIIKQSLPVDSPPHPDDSPIQIHYDLDMGWIVEDLNEGEYEVHNLPWPNCKNSEPDIKLAIEISDGREIWICPK